MRTIYVLLVIDAQLVCVVYQYKNLNSRKKSARSARCGRREISRRKYGIAANTAGKSVWAANIFSGKSVIQLTCSASTIQVLPFLLPFRSLRSRRSTWLWVLSSQSRTRRKQTPCSWKIWTGRLRCRMAGRKSHSSRRRRICAAGRSFA